MVKGLVFHEALILKAVQQWYGPKGSEEKALLLV